MTTKIIQVTLEALKIDDTLIATALDAGTETLNWKALREPITFTGNLTYRRTRTREFVSWGGGAEKGFPLDSMYRVRRALTGTEIEAAKADSAHRAADDIRRRIQDPMRPLIAARDKLIDALQTSYANDPARALSGHTADVAVAQAHATCWGTVARIAAFLHQSDVEAGTIRRFEDAPDATVLKAVLLTLRGVERDLLSGDFSRSTNPYSNAVEDDVRKGTAAWRRDYTVLHAVTAAKAVGVTVEDDE